MALLFLGESNAGRSVLAEAIARHLAPELDVYSAGITPSHVRPEVRRMLAESGVRDDGLRAKNLAGVPLDEVTTVIRVSRHVTGQRLPARLRVLDWPLPDPTAAPPEERLDAWRAARDELWRRIDRLFREEPEWRA